MREASYRLRYRSDIEGLRAVAILLVVAAHAGVTFLRGGFVGVDVFFVLSGYLITGLLLKEIGDTGGIRFGAFYARRLQRLLPALLVMIVLTSLLAVVIVSPSEQPFQAIGAATASVWLSNMHFALARLSYFGPGAESNLFLHTWSLGVEEQFYLIWPALLYLALSAWRGRRLGVNKSRLKAVMLAVFGLSLTACVVLTAKAPQLAFYLMPSRAWQFALGALVFLYSRPAMAPAEATAEVAAMQPARRFVAASLIEWLGLAAVLLAGVWFGPDMPYPGVQALLPSVGAAALLFAGAAAEQGGAIRLLSWRPLQLIGRVSYSWYLWHWPVLLLGAQLRPDGSPAYRLLLVVVSLGLAIVSYRLVEAPIRRNAGLLNRPGTVAVAGVALMVLASIGSIDWYNAVNRWLQSPQQQRFIAASMDVPAIYAMGCDQWYYSAVVRVCGFGAPDATRTAMLVGDSVGVQWFPAVRRIFDRPGWRLLVITKSACPMVDVPFFYPRIGREYNVSAEWRRKALQDIASIKPTVLMLGSTSTYGFTRTQWIDGTTKVLQHIDASVQEVYLIRATPHLPFDGPACLMQQRWLDGLIDMRHSCSSNGDGRKNAEVYRWLGEVAGHFPNVHLLDMNPLVCPDGRCKAERQGVVIFRSRQHLTASFAGSLASPMAQRMAVLHILDRNSAQSLSALHAGDSGN